MGTEGRRSVTQKFTFGDSEVTAQRLRQEKTFFSEATSGRTPRANSSNGILRSVNKRPPVEQMTARGSGKSRQYENAANVPEQEHYRNVFRMKEPQGKIGESGSRQRAKSSRQTRREGSAMTQHQRHEYCGNRSQENDERKAGQIMLQRQSSIAKPDDALRTAFPHASQPDSERNKEQREKTAVVSGDGAGKSCGCRANSNRQR